ncbi:hypothetical protein BKA65DRAFT_263667 [Rhexocercosporidium sp. MPI-PUGE-AT-0058]|nr:hypothetical protein BKA65DRAFT_263667 [Rhexocercosporidium sp. MPI-PUGE-AT-0058]
MRRNNHCNSPPNFYFTVTASISAMPYKVKKTVNASLRLNTFQLQDSLCFHPGLGHIMQEHHTSSIPFDKSLNLTRMSPIKIQHGQQHKPRIKTSGPELILQQPPILTLAILHQPEHRTDHDEATRSIQNTDVFLPWREGVQYLHVRVLDMSSVEDASYNEEESEEHYLDEEACFDESRAIFAIACVFALCLQARAYIEVHAVTHKTVPRNIN